MSEAKGLRFNTGKPPISLVLEARDAINGVAKVLEFGMKKYSRGNWRRGLKHTGIADCLGRHLGAWLAGEDNDNESGLPHVDHVLCNALFLSEMYHRRPDLDDRFVLGRDDAEDAAKVTGLPSIKPHNPPVVEPPVKPSGEQPLSELEQSLLALNDALRAAAADLEAQLRDVKAERDKQQVTIRELIDFNSRTRPFVPGVPIDRWEPRPTPPVIAPLFPGFPWPHHPFPPTSPTWMRDNIILCGYTEHPNDFKQVPDGVSYASACGGPSVTDTFTGTTQNPQ